MKLNPIYLAVPFFSLVLAACSSGSDDDDPLLKGRFIDSAVEGLRYEADSHSGMTDSEGRFSYRAGDNVSFYVGDVFLGDAPATPVMTPISLVDGAVDHSHPKVQNIVRFLMSIDDDGDAGNGILITEETFDMLMELEIDFAAGDFDSRMNLILGDLIEGTTTVSPTLPTVDEANLHLQDSISEEVAGLYTGRYTTQGGGTWEVVILSGGLVAARLLTNQGSEIIFSGEVSVRGDISGDFTGKVGLISKNLSVTFVLNDMPIQVSGSRSLTLWEFLEKEGIVGGDAGDSVGTTGPVLGGSGGSVSVENPGNASAGGSVDNLSISGNTGLPGVFSPMESLITDSANGELEIGWFQGLTNNDSLELYISFDQNNNVLAMALLGDIGGDTWVYGLECTINDCSGISIDTVDMIVTFDQVSLIAPPTPSNMADSAIVLDGVMSY